ncbi:MAG TPA: S8 family serine peptidase [Polyangiaceae bacterium]|jgi:subtilisin family serine protease|nr:S8 family serine peptidase [Polyangiaceae bacterium]
MTVPIEKSGAGVRVAIVDSGVDPSHPWFAHAKLTHLRVENPPSGPVVVPDGGGDQSGHGTACAGIIHRMAPEAELVSLRALGPDGRCSRNALIAALHHCIKERFDVVNLSLGIDVPRQAPLRAADHKPILTLYELADAANTLGVVLVASGPNVAQFRTYPGRFKALIGVGRASFAEMDGLATARTADHEILAPGTDVLAPALGGGERRWTGTSFACPFVTAHVARIRAARPGLPIEEIKMALHALAALHEAHIEEAS